MKKHTIILFAHMLLVTYCVQATDSEEVVDPQSNANHTANDKNSSPLVTNTQAFFALPPDQFSSFCQEFERTALLGVNELYPFKNAEEVKDHSFLLPSGENFLLTSQSHIVGVTPFNPLPFTPLVSLDEHDGLSQPLKIKEFYITKNTFQSIPFELVTRNLQANSPNSLTFFGEEISDEQIQAVLREKKSVNAIYFLHLDSIRSYSFLKEIKKCNTLSIHSCGAVTLQNPLELTELVELTLSIRDIRNKALKETVKRNPNLKLLDLSTSTIEQKTLKKVIKYLPNLETFYCAVSKKASVNSDVIAEMQAHMKKLKIFGILRKDFNFTVLKGIEKIESLEELHLLQALDQWTPEFKTRLKVTVVS